jgi:hypothetical protein
MSEPARRDEPAAESRRGVVVQYHSCSEKCESTEKKNVPGQWSAGMAVTRTERGRSEVGEERERVEEAPGTSGRRREASIPGKRVGRRRAVVGEQ